MQDIHEREKTFETTNGRMIINHSALRREIANIVLFCREKRVVAEEELMYEFVCYYCDMEICIIKSEEEDIGNSEEDRKAFFAQTIYDHIDDSPSCAHMIKIKGVDFIENYLNLNGIKD